MSRARLEKSQEADEGRGDVSGGLRFRGIGAIVGEGVVHLRSPHHRSRQLIRVGVAAEEVGRPLLARYLVGMRRHRRQRRPPVVYPPRKLAAVPHHVRHAQRISSQYIVHLQIFYAYKLIN